MVMFQRARSEQQRAQRRQAILDAAAAMLAEMPVAEVTLSELSRRVGLAKSNVLRYFESREAVLLELLDSAAQEWLAQLEQDLPAAVDPAAARADRIDQLAAVITASLATRPILCDLAGAQSAVLERNVSARVAAEFKRAVAGHVARLSALVAGCLPELGAVGALQVAGATVLVAGALWPAAQPSAAMLAAYAADPSLAAMRLDFATTLRELLAVLAAGVAARAERRGSAAIWPVGQPAGQPADQP